jgi:hypothetical protein
MPYVAKDDIILYIENEVNFIQGSPATYEFELYKDFIGNPLNLNEPTSFHVAIFSGDRKVLQYSEPQNIGNSDTLNVYKSEGQGRLDFTVTEQQSANVKAGDLTMEVTVIFENYYPAPKTYIFPRLAIGNAIADPNAGGGDTGGGSGDGGSGGGTNVISKRSPKFTVEFVDGSNPTNIGMLSLNSNIPASVTEIVFRNLDETGTRISKLENFLMNRIGLEGINGTIVLEDTDETNLYAIYKIKSWERIDITAGDGDADNSDGIKINVVMENKSYGPGVTKSLWEVGQKLTYSLDAIGIAKTELMPEGILTYVDKYVNSQATTGDAASTGITISYSPYQDSFVMVEVNGISVEVGDGETDKAVYFSGNNGLTATSIEEIRSGDQLIWNGNVAGYDLEVDDEINLIYEARADDLR